MILFGIDPLHIVAAVVAWRLVHFLWVYIQFLTSPLWSLPGPRYESYIMGQFGKIRREPFCEPHKRWWKKAGLDTKFIHYTLPVGTHTILVLDADVVREILFSNYGENPRFVKKLMGLIPLVGNGLVTLEGKDWQRHRRIVHPSFQPGLIRESLGHYIPNIMRTFIGFWEKAEGREITVMNQISNLTLEIIGEVAFSHDFHALDSIEQWVHEGEDGVAESTRVNDRVVQAMTSMFENTGTRILMQLMNISFLDFSTAKSSKMLDEAVDEVVTAAKLKLEKTKMLEKGDATKTLGFGQISLLQRLLDAENSDTKKSSRKSLVMEELRDEVKTFLLAGHETTATWCHWAIFALCKNPEIQELVFADIETHSSKDEESDITIEMIEKMTYFDAFMKEVLRMYPPAGMIVRYNVYEEHYKGLTIPAGTRLTIPIHLLHRHPLYWKDPDVFQPERWLGKEHPASNKHAYMPFSNGPRNCIGYYFAEMEAKLLMAPLIRHFVIRLSPSQKDVDFKFTTSITMKSNPSLKIVTNVRGKTT